MDIKKWKNTIKEDKNLARRAMWITVISALLVAVLLIRGNDSTGTFIVDDNGNVAGIVRASMENLEEYKLILEIESEDGSEERLVKIVKNAQSTGVDSSADADEQLAIREAEIESIISDIELSDKKKILFPTMLSDGSRLLWRIDEEKSKSWIGIVIMYFFLIVLLIKDGIDKAQNEGKKNRREIIRALPRFTNQLLLMMNAGMILNDAFEKISHSYSIMDDQKKGYFEKSIIDIYERNIDSRTSTAYLINEFAVNNSVKELMRISAILTENEKRGSDVIDNLSRESMYLWDERKIVARENGKMIDTKMTYPLGILLILLIVITMAPALLNM